MMNGFIVIYIFVTVFVILCCINNYDFWRIIFSILFSNHDTLIVPSDPLYDSSSSNEEEEKSPDIILLPETTTIQSDTTY
jgi:hypothetical protein